VRLKVNLIILHSLNLSISIPSGAIKRQFQQAKIHLQILISIPSGAIKREVIDYVNRNEIGNFNSFWCD